MVEGKMLERDVVSSILHSLALVWFRDVGHTTVLNVLIFFGGRFILSCTSGWQDKWMRDGGTRCNLMQESHWSQTLYSPARSELELGQRQIQKSHIYSKGVIQLFKLKISTMTTLMKMMIIMMLAFLTKFPPTVKFRSDQVKFPEATRQIYGAGWTLNTASL